MISTSGFLTALNCTKFVFGWGSPYPAAGAYSAPPYPLAGLRGPTSGERGKRGRGYKGVRKGRGWEGKEWREGQMSHPSFLNVPAPLMGDGTFVSAGFF